MFDNKRGKWTKANEIPPYYTNNNRGNDLNDIYACGDFGLFAHYNGSGWKVYNELSIQGIYYSLSAKNNTVVTVGFEGSKAIIIFGNRN